MDGKYFEADADKAEAGDPLHNQSLSAGDVVIVAQRDQSQIYAVSGAVMQPYAAPWKPNAKLTLTRAIELAGGLSPKAEGKTGVLRQGYFRNPISAPTIPFDLQQIRAGKQKNWEISPGDEITIMPKTPGREWWRGILPFVFHLLPL
jgi:protein involved in polysaccharide export with SLBB domain